MCKPGLLAPGRAPPGLWHVALFLQGLLLGVPPWRHWAWGRPLA